MQLLDVLLYVLIGVQLFISCWQLMQLSSSLHWMRQRQLTSAHKAGVQRAAALCRGRGGTLSGGQVIPRIFPLPLFASVEGKLRVDIRRQPLTPEDTRMNTVHILIPVYNEAAVIKACVEYFDKLARYPNVLIHYVTTEKEGADSATVAALKQMPEQYKFSHLHYPETHGFKAHQLNWAIKHILATYKSADHQATYFGIYDVDSRPEVEVIK